MVERRCAHQRCVQRPPRADLPAPCHLHSRSQQRHRKGNSESRTMGEHGPSLAMPRRLQIYDRWRSRRGSVDDQNAVPYTSLKRRLPPRKKLCGVLLA
jgi:hypothetical protein